MCYKVGMRLRLIHMDEVQSPPPGTIGVIYYIDSTGMLHMHWENGSSLGLIPNLDEFEVVGDEA